MAVDSCSCSSAEARTGAERGKGGSSQGQRSLTLLSTHATAKPIDGPAREVVCRANNKQVGPPARGGPMEIDTVCLQGPSELP